MSKRILPAEWARQDGVLLTWPHRYSDWAASLSEVENVFIRLAQAISRRESLIVVCYNDEHRKSVRRKLSSASVDLAQVRFCIARSNDTWARDHGPITVLDAGKPCVLDFNFNGWGGKYPADLDNRITGHLMDCSPFSGLAFEEIDFVLEGGSIETEGNGTLLTTSSCLLSERRNANIDRASLESTLGRHLGIERILWLNHGQLEGDDTDGHIDTLARFTDASTLAYCACDAADDGHYEPLRAMYRELAELRDVRGNPYRLVDLPLPTPKYDPKGNRLPATYANFLVINEAVLLPTYDDPADSASAERLRTCFPDREIVSIPCTPLIQQSGSLHCVTMQLPAGVLQT